MLAVNSRAPFQCSLRRDALSLLAVDDLICFDVRLEQWRGDVSVFSGRMAFLSEIVV